MSLPSYKKYYIGFCTQPKNISAAFNSRIGWYCVPSWQEGTLYDGYIILCAENDKALHDILEDRLDTPVGVGDVQPTF